MDLDLNSLQTLAIYILHRLIEEHRNFQSQLEQKIADLEHHLKDKERELEVTSTELERQKEANVRAPTTSMKNLVERLRNQLELKEKQHKVRIFASN